MQNKLSFLMIYKKTVLFISACLSISLSLILLARHVQGFAQWYAVHVYPVIPPTYGRLFSEWEHSFFEALILSAFTVGALLAIIGPCLLLFKRSYRKNCLSYGLRLVICMIAGLVLVYTVTCAVNYHRDSIGTVLALPREEITRENLVKLSFLLANELTELTNDPDWDYSLLAVNEITYIEAEAINTMKQLGKQESSLAGYYPNPKPVHFSETLSSLGVEGFFSPFTMEANYNNEITPFLIPYTICHELAHLKGYMKEDDAGFIAYLACRNSSSLVFQYSGTFRALIFTLNELGTQGDAEEFNQIYQTLPEPVRIQLSYIKDQNQKTDGSYRSVAKKVNNLYLKANAQSGTMSYGKIVELLISDYAEQINDENLL